MGTGLAARGSDRHQGLSPLAQDAGEDVAPATGALLPELSITPEQCFEQRA